MRYCQRLTTSQAMGSFLRAAYVGSIGTGSAEEYAGRTLTHESWSLSRSLAPVPGRSTRCKWRPYSGLRLIRIVSAAAIGSATRHPFLSASFGCNTARNSCTNDCSRPYWIRWRNFMDYADGNCANMFTQRPTNANAWLPEQHVEPLDAPAISQQQLLTATGINITNPCAPKADFHVKGLTDH